MDSDWSDEDPVPARARKPAAGNTDADADWGALPRLPGFSSAPAPAARPAKPAKDVAPVARSRFAPPPEHSDNDDFSDDNGMSCTI